GGGGRARPDGLPRNCAAHQGRLLPLRCGISSAAARASQGGGRLRCRRAQGPAGALRARGAGAAAAAQIAEALRVAMQYLLLGFAALLLFLLAARAYTMANPQVLARQLRIGAGVAALVGAGLLVFRGLVGYAISLATLGSWLLWGQGGLSGFGGRAQKTAGQTSRVTTEHLEVELDHDTGNVHGRILKGFFVGRRLEDLRPVELAHLWQDWRFTDPPSAQIVEAHLGRLHPAPPQDM